MEEEEIAPHKIHTTLRCIRTTKQTKFISKHKDTRVRAERVPGGRKVLEKKKKPTNWQEQFFFLNIIHCYFYFSTFLSFPTSLYSARIASITLNVIKNIFKAFFWMRNVMLLLWSCIRQTPIFSTQAPTLSSSVYISGRSSWSWSTLEIPLFGQLDNIYCFTWVCFCIYLPCWSEASRSSWTCF